MLSTAEGVAAVAAEFERVLDTPVSGSDDFFALGGTSLLAVRVVAGLTARSGKLLTLVDLLRLRTPEVIAAHLGAAPPAPARQLAAAAPGEQHELSPPQRWYSQVYAGPRQRSGVMSFAVELPDGTVPEAAWRAWDRLLSRHDALRTCVREVGGRLVQRVLDPDEAPRRPPWRTVVEVPGGRAEVARAGAELSAERAGAGIPLDGELPHRAVLVRGADPAGARPAQLGLVVHHLVCDGPSAAVLARELLALLADPEADLPAAPSYRAYTSWRLGRETPEQVETERRWWRERLAGSGGPLLLPLRGEPEGYVGYVVSHTLPDPLREAVAAAAKRHAVPVSAPRLAAWFVLCHALYGTRDVLVGQPIGMRVLPELRDAVGMFANHALLRHRLAAGESVEDLVRTAYAELSAAVEHRDHGFDRAMEQWPERYEPGRFPFSGAVVNGGELDPEPGPPATEPATEGLRRCGVSDLQLYFGDGPDRVDVELQHRADVLGPADGRRVLECYLGVLARLVEPAGERAVEPLVDAATAVLRPVLNGLGEPLRAAD